jgi:hypothetical protein
VEISEIPNAMINRIKPHTGMVNEGILVAAIVKKR